MNRKLKRYGSRFFFWRGVLGGILGMFLLCLYLYYRYPILGFAGGYLPLILGFAGSLGGLVAVIVLGVRKIFRVDLGLIPRSLIGVLIPALGAWFHLYNTQGTDFAGNALTQHQKIVFSIVFGLAVGLLPGILSGRVRKYSGQLP